jgi:GTP-binding protein EngB required for normal cell division
MDNEKNKQADDKQNEQIKSSLIRVIGNMLKQIDEIIPVIRSNRFLREFREELLSIKESTSDNIVFVGGFNTGKSTIINALLKSNILPVGINPTTGLIYEIIHSKEKKAYYVTSHPSREEIDIESLDKFNIGGSGNPGAKSECKIVIHYPIPICDDGRDKKMTDTPGLNDPNEFSQTTTNYCTKASIIVYCINALMAYSETDKKMIDFLRNEKGYTSMLFVINQMDRLDESEREKLRRSLDTTLSGLTKFGKHGIFYISAQNELGKKAETNEFKSFEEALKKRIKATLEMLRDISERLTNWEQKVTGETTEYLEKNLQPAIIEKNKEIELLNSLLDENENAQKSIKRTVKSAETEIKAYIDGKIESLFYKAAGKIETWVNKCYTTFHTDIEKYCEIHSGNIKEKFEQLSEETWHDISDKTSEVISELQANLLLLMNKYLLQKQNIALSHKSVYAGINLPSMHGNDSATDIISGLAIHVGGMTAVLIGILQAIPIINLLGGILIVGYAIWGRRRMKADFINSYKSFFCDRSEIQKFSSTVFERIVNSEEYKKLIDIRVNSCYKVLEDDHKQMETNRKELDKNKQQIEKEIQETKRFIGNLDND